ncbi:MAG TPA: LuxR C-terminal-related transcriptional regulator [Actinoplanes sp.]|jgi:DNA-binding CsgD family transcriptional regulator
MERATRLEVAREAHRDRRWEQAYAAFAELDAETPLDSPDLELAAESADLAGHEIDSIPLLRRAYQAYADAGTVTRALRCAYWLCKGLAWGGEFAEAGAWFGRASRLADTDPTCPARAYVLMSEAERLFWAGDYPGMLTLARSFGAFGDRSDDADVRAGTAMLLGRALIWNGEVGAGLAELDDAMVTVGGGTASARAVGMVYCAVIDACQEVHDLRRAKEWTAKLAAWYESQPEFTGAYRGLCRVHRVAILRLSGGWPTAVTEARSVCTQMTRGFGEVVAGAAFYQLGELYRLRGEFADAERAYRDALRYGGETQPGMALLRLGQGKPEAATSAIRRALAEASGPLQRARLLPAAVEIFLAGDDQPAASSAAEDLANIAAEYDTTALHAMSAYASGAVALSECGYEAALPPLRRAYRLWRDLDVPYEAARSRVLLALACRELGDEDSAAMELDTARQVFDHLGAAPETARVQALAGHPAVSSGLSPRELEVVRLIAAGRTNSAIAAELYLSEKTVARHVSNIFGKLGVGTRTAAAAYAFEHGLV